MSNWSCETQQESGWRPSDDLVASGVEAPAAAVEAPAAASGVEAPAAAVAADVPAAAVLEAGAGSEPPAAAVVEQVINKSYDPRFIELMKKIEKKIEECLSWQGSGVEAAKLTIIEHRLMNANIEVHESTRQCQMAVDVYNHNATDPSWFIL